LEKVTDKLYDEERKHRKPMEYVNKRQGMADPGELLAFKNDLMQLVVNCQFKDFRPRVRICLYLDFYRSGNYSLGPWGSS
jgi:hypothetical protein